MRVLFFLFWCCALCAVPKAVVFDFGGVITTVDEKPVLSYIHDTLKTSAEKDFAGDTLYAALDEGENFWKGYAASHGKTLPPEWMPGLQQRAKLLVRPIPGMAELLAQLKSEGYRVALLSNTTKNRSNYFRKHGFYKPFDPIILSSDVNVSKPDPRIYQITLEELDLPAPDCIFVDNAEKNVIAASKLGFHAILFKSAKQLRVDLAKLLPQRAKEENRSKLPDARIGSLE